MVMKCVTALLTELAGINRLAVYSVIINAVDASFSIMTIAILGHLGKGHLSAGVIALAFYNISWFFIEGLLTAQDSLVARSFALNDRQGARYWSYISFGVAVLICVPTTILFIFAAIIMQFAFLIRPHTAAKAAEFLILLLPGLWCHAFYRVFQKYLQCQRKMSTPIICGVAGIIANFILSYLLTFVIGFGFSGCALGTSISRAIMLIMIASFVFKVEDVKRAVEEVTLLGRQIKEQYTGIEELGSPTAVTTRKSSLTSNDGKKSKRKGKKVRIAPVDHDDAEEPQSQYNSEATSQELEMVPLTHTEPSIHSNSGGANNGADSKTADGIEHGGVAHFSEAKMGDESVPDAENGTESRDTESLLPSNAASSSSSSGYSDGTAVGSAGGAAGKKAVLADTLRFLFLGLPGGLVLGMEFWVFEVVTVIIAHMGSVTVGTNQILMTITSFFFLSLPFAVSVAATVQISRLLAKKRHRKARLAAYLCLLEGSALMAVAAAVMYVLRDHVGYLFTSNQDILSRLRTMAPYNAGFQVAYGVYGSAQGVLRATSHQIDILGWTFLTVWLGGLPIGLYLAFVVRPTYGLEGLWIGLIIGMSLLAATLVLQVYLLDWEKESRKAEYRLRKSGNANRLTMLDYESTLTELEIDEVAITSRSFSGTGRISTSLNPMRVSDPFNDVALPTIGSRAAGGLPMEDFFRSAEDEMAEFEFMEYGDPEALIATRGDHGNSGGSSSSVTKRGGGGPGASSASSGAEGAGNGTSGGDSLFDDEEDHKRNK